MKNTLRKIFTLKNVLFLFCLLPVYPVMAQRFNVPVKEIEPAQFTATYSLSYQEDSLNPDDVRKEDMLLFLGKNVSKFTSANSYNLDTMSRKIKSQAEFLTFMSKLFTTPSIKTNFRYQIFKNYPRGKITTIDFVPMSKKFRYEENLNLFHWKLIDDTATMSGYKVQKATCNFGGRSWVAWFTPDIPYRDGPYKFNGLPGLIVKIYDTRDQYVFDLKSFIKPKYKIMIDYVEDDFIKTSKQDFFKAEDAVSNDIVNRIKAMGINSEGQQRAAKNMARRNNPLELKRK